MRKLEIADADVMRIAIQQEIQRSEESRYGHRLFKQMGFRFRKPRPQVAQSDPKKVEASKKTAPAGEARRR